MEDNELEKKYNESINFLFSRLPMFSRTGAAAYKPGLDTSLKLAEFFNNPHSKFPSIHIAGTNGKGSTSHLISSILQSQGYKVGLYTSPHLVDFRERMRINGQMIPKQSVVDFVDKWKNSGYSGQPSFFELTMIMAFNWFAREKVDYAVIEVGMGGRLDSTNIISPVLSVITNISHDHNQFLGNTLSEIAREKAGIIKQDTPVVIGETQPEIEQVFINTAKEKNAEITFADQTPFIFPEIKKEIETGQISLPLKGDYQKKNILTVLAAIHKLKESGVVIDTENIIKGVENVCINTGLAGRWMIIGDNPLVIADTGHNIGGLSYNVAQLQRLLSEKPKATLRMIIGFVADKAIDKILDILPMNAEYYITNAQIPRALPALELLSRFVSRGFQARAFSDVESAYRNAKKEASEEDIIYIGGSTFVVADFLNYLHLYDGHALSTDCC